MSKLIPLTQNQYALVDNEDYEYLMQWKWQAYYNKNPGTYYVLRSILKSERINGKKGTILMHRAIMGCPQGLTVDHINHDTLDNRKSNLRVCTQSQNNMNTRKYSNNKSGYKGVMWHKYSKRWCAEIRANKKKIHLGYFVSKEEAYEAYCVAVKKYHGEFAYKNTVKEIKS